MASQTHSYALHLRWTGNGESGTSDYCAYSRDYDIVIAGKPVLRGSSDPAFRGDAARYNPEEMLVASLSSCHMLWYLHLCAVKGVVVLAYEDRAEAEMTLDAGGGGHFTRTVLRPLVTISAASDADMARALHHEAHDKCFIANSVNFPVIAEPEIAFEV